MADLMRCQGTAGWGGGRGEEDEEEEEEETYVHDLSSLLQRTTDRIQVSGSNATT